MQNAHIQMVPDPNFLGLPRDDLDEVYRDPYPGIIGGNYGKDMSYNPWKAAEMSQSQIL